MLNKLFLLCLVLCINQFVFGQKSAKQYCSEVLPPLRNIHGIIGGVQTDNGEFPHMVALGYGSDKNPEWLCGGSLISPQFVLTAGHCTQTQRGPVIKVRLGTRTLVNPSLGYEDIKVRDIIDHPNYKPPSHYNDIALLRLAKNVTISGIIIPACLQTSTSIGSAQLMAIGWGKTDFAGQSSNDLLKVDLQTFTRSTCNKYYKNVEKSRLERGIDNKIQICAGSGSNEERDTCQGDSGGPLGYKKGKYHYISGITSFGKACGLADIPAVYTRISAFVPWIESIVWK